MSAADAAFSPLSRRSLRFATLSLMLSMPPPPATPRNNKHGYGCRFATPASATPRYAIRHDMLRRMLCDMLAPLPCCRHADAATTLPMPSPYYVNGVTITTLLCRHRGCLMSTVINKRQCRHYYYAAMLLAYGCHAITGLMLRYFHAAATCFAMAA